MGSRVRDAVGSLGRGGSVTFGFMLRRLTLAGAADLPNAELNFARGLNVISGPSDTGKTFIAQCINFVLGASSPPKEIKEASKYTLVFLEIESRSTSKVYILQRALRGGGIRLSTDGEADRILGEKHHPDRKDTISSFLLNLSGLDGKVVRTNQQGLTRQLSFRDIARLILIDEESVISSESPILSGQVVTRTVESNVFRLLMTGIDDSSVIAKVDPKIARGRLEGKAELLSAMLQQAKDQVTDQNITSTIEEVRDQLNKLNEAYEIASAELAREQNSATELEQRRRSAWTRLRQVESKVDVLGGLQKRFELLQAQYSSDLRRLEAIAEAGIRLGQLNEERCPVCGALAEHHESKHQQVGATPSDVAEACKAEAEKTARLVIDLQTTLISNAAELELLCVEQNEWQAELESIGTELNMMLQPRLQSAVEKFRKCQANHAICRREMDLLERVRELDQLLTEATAPPKRERPEVPSSTVSTGVAEKFSQGMEELLRSWNFPDLGRVVFSEDDQDVVISGQPRRNHGKGVRAITHAAFNLALLKFCVQEEHPFPGMVLIDSPLVVYREPDVDEGGFSPDVKGAFYDSVARMFRDEQVIVLENDDPPESVSASANTVTFTGNEHGRWGFIPRV